MRDEKYYQKLKQIRQKYDFLNVISRENNNQTPPPRLSQPLMPHQSNKPNPLKELHERVPSDNKRSPFELQTKIDQAITRKHKENISMSPLLFRNEANKPQGSIKQRQMRNKHECKLALPKSKEDWRERLGTQTPRTNFQDNIQLQIQQSSPNRYENSYMVNSPLCLLENRRETKGPQHSQNWSKKALPNQTDWRQFEREKALSSYEPLHAKLPAKQPQNCCRSDINEWEYPIQKLNASINSIANFQQRIQSMLNKK